MKDSKTHIFLIFAGIALLILGLTLGVLLYHGMYKIVGLIFVVLFLLMILGGIVAHAILNYKPIKGVLKWILVAVIAIVVIAMLGITLN